MEIYNQNGLPLYRFNSLGELDGIVHGVTTRKGGVSLPPFDSLDLGLGRGVDQDILANLEIVKNAFGLDKMVYAYQAHGVDIRHVQGNEDLPVSRVDGLATDRPGVGLLIKQADCQAVILAAPDKAVCNLHVGWRGNVADMPGVGVKFMASRYGIDPGELHAAIAPSLGPCHAEFINHPNELGPDFLPYQESPDHFNLWRVTKDQLIRAGVRPGWIEISDICTVCHPDFYSYRRDKITGRFATLVALK
jgi:YfiH family protein